MADHPSLRAKIDMPAPVVALQSMAPYVLCWCGSGKKYKFCHFRREKEKPANLFEDQAAMMRALRDSGYCSHPDHSSCSNSISKSHSLQRNGGLAAISENHHVLTVKSNLRSMIDNDGKPPPRQIGIARASVFPGFCDFHDNVVFTPIEGASITLDRPAAFLFSYRAVSYERFHKQAQLNSIVIQRQADCGQPLWKQELIQRYMNSYEYGIRRGFRDIESWKHVYDVAIVNDDYSDFHFFAMRFDNLFPVVVCCDFHVELDVNGKVLQKLGTNEQYEGLSLTITAFNNASIAVLGWMGGLDGPSAKFVHAFRALPDDRKADALIRLAFHQSDNLFMRESWWSGLSVANQALLLDAVQSGTQMRARKSDDLVDKGNTLATGNVVEAVLG